MSASKGNLQQANDERRRHLQDWENGMKSLMFLTYHNTILVKEEWIRRNLSESQQDVDNTDVHLYYLHLVVILIDFF